MSFYFPFSFPAALPEKHQLTMLWFAVHVNIAVVKFNDKWYFSFCFTKIWEDDHLTEEYLEMMLTLSKILGCQRLIKNPVGPVGLLSRNWHENAIQVAREKPQIGWTKLNFDGSCKCSTGRASIGGVIRDHNAVFLLGYAESIGHTTSTIAEMAALRRGLELILENGWSQVWLEGDLQSLVEIIMQGRRVRSAEAQKQVSHIKLLIPELDNFLITHIYREGNRVAHTFAQMGHRLKHPQIWRHIPNEVLRNILRENAEGKIVYRKR